MRELLIVDDEEIILHGMKNLFDWQALGYMLHLAKDGADAVECLRQWPIDLLLTDITMPHMDGIALAREAAYLRPQCMVVLISGYNEFTYAQEAIQIGVFRYLTKPIQKERLLTLLQEIDSIIAQRAYERRRFESLQNFFDEHKPLLVERFFLALAKVPMSHELACVRARELGLAWDFAHYLCLVLSLDHRAPLHIRDETALYLSVRTILATNFEALGGQPHFFEEYPGEPAVLIGFIQNSEMPYGHIFHALSATQEYVRLYLGVSVTLGVSRLATGEDQIPVLYEQARHALEYKPSLGDGSILFIDDFTLSVGVEQLFASYRASLDKLISAIKNANGPLATQTVSELCDRIQSSGNITRTQLNIISTDVWVSLQKLALEYTDMLETILSSTDFRTERASVSSITGLAELLRPIVQQMILFMDQHRKVKSKAFVAQAKAFIRTNFAMQNLSLTTLAQEVFVSAAYLSQCFKQSEHISCIEYLTLVRIDEAKRLLRETNLKTYEIAQAVGYVDAQYFSTIFKKSVGASPTDYRKYAATV